MLNSPSELAAVKATVIDRLEKMVGNVLRGVTNILLRPPTFDPSQATGPNWYTQELEASGFWTSKPAMNKKV